MWLKFKKFDEGITKMRELHGDWVAEAIEKQVNEYLEKDGEGLLRIEVFVTFHLFKNNERPDWLWTFHTPKDDVYTYYGAWTVSRNPYRVLHSYGKQRGREGYVTQLRTREWKVVDKEIVSPPSIYLQHEYMRIYFAPLHADHREMGCW